MLIEALKGEVNVSWEIEMLVADIRIYFTYVQSTLNLPHFKGRKLCDSLVGQI